MQRALHNESSTSSEEDDNWITSFDGPLAIASMQQQELLSTATMLTVFVQTEMMKRRRMITRRGGSLRGRAPNIQRSFDEFYQRVMNNYFIERPRFNDRVFRQRFRCRKALFLAAVETITSHDDYFRQRPDATGRLGMTPLHKIIVAWRKLCYGYGNDSMDESFEVAASTNREILDHFCDACIEIWENQFIRRPNAADIERIGTMMLMLTDFFLTCDIVPVTAAKQNESRGFRGALMSIDCTHWAWAKCPKSFQGQFRNGRKDYCSVVMEAGCSPDRRIWHLFCTIPGTCNDINILDSSPLFDDILSGESPVFKYQLNGNDYSWLYYLVDGIYPAWRIFARPLSQPANECDANYTKEHEGARKDIECTFGILKKKFLIVKHPAEFWKLETMHKVMKTIVIWHNMILEDEFDEEDLDGDDEFDQGDGQVRSLTQQENESIESEVGGVVQGLGARMRRMRDEDDHYHLREDLAQHLWDRRSQRSV